MGHTTKTSKKYDAPSLVSLTCKVMVVLAIINGILAKTAKAN
jgi:hypothetical protein